MKPLYNHVVIIGIDGMGNFNKDAVTPNIDKKFANGATTFDALSLFPTISAQNWGAMLLGAEPEVHGLTNSIVSTKEYHNKKLPSVFTTVRNAFPDAFLCSCSNWDPINYGIIEHDIGVEMHTADNDKLLCDIIEECISRKPKLLFIQSDDVDGAGHGNGYGTEKYLQAITEADEFSGRIFNAYEKAGIADETLFIEIADHGGYDHGHGGYHDTEKYIFFGVAGKGIAKSHIPFAQTKDVNAIVRYAFGIDIPDFSFDEYSSQVPENIFESTKPYIRPENTTIEFNTEETPEYESENGLSNVFDSANIKTALFFDNNCCDASGNLSFVEHNFVKYYSTGRYGAYGELGNTGYITNDVIKFSKNSFSVAFWVKIDKAIDDFCCICSTRNMNESSDGFSVGFSNAGTFLNIRNNDYEETYSTTCVNETEKGWMHVIYAFNREDNKAEIYYNFKHRRTITLNDNFKDFSFDNLPFTVGNDASGSLNISRKFIFNIDDFIVIGKSIDANEIIKLASYYNN